MKYQNTMDARQYLYKFDEILYQMTIKMFTQETLDNITKNFIMCMIPHHQAAIYMCENLLSYKYYDTDVLIKIANNIIKNQTEGIKQMQEILPTTKGYQNAPMYVNNYEREYYKIVKNMILKMQNSPKSQNIDLNFVNEMISHYEGAILMCKNLLKYRLDPRLKLVADTIIKQQSEGIKQMKEIRNNLTK